MTKIERNPSAYEHRRVEAAGCPRHSVASQLKIFTPVGTAIDHRRDHEEGLERDRQADREHVVRPDEHREEADRDRRERDRLVAEDRLAGEDGRISEMIPKAGSTIDVTPRGDRRTRSACW